MRSNRVIWSVVAGLILLNLAVGIMAYRYIGRVDRNYTRLLNEGIPFLNEMQTATGRASRSYAILVDLTQAQTPAEIAALETELRSNRDVSDRIFASPLFEKAVPAELRPAYDSLRSGRNQGLERRTHFLELVRTGRSAEATAYLRMEIYPAHKTFLTNLDRFCDRYQESLATLTRELAAENAQSRSLLVGISGAPLLLVGLTGLGTVLTILFLVFSILFSRRAASER